MELAFYALAALIGIIMIFKGLSKNDPIGKADDALSKQQDGIDNKIKETEEKLGNINSNNRNPDDVEKYYNKG